MLAVQIILSIVKLIFGLFWGKSNAPYIEAPDDPRAPAFFRGKRL
jgi:hypothetical protein